MTDHFDFAMSPTVGAIAAAIVKAQARMHPAAKAAYNPHFKSHFADYDAIWEACAPLREEGIAIMQPPARATRDGHVAIVTLLVHAASGEWIRSYLELPATKTDPQGEGSALTYAQRYALRSTCCVVTGEDDDGEGAMSRPPAPRREPAPAPRSAAQAPRAPASAPAPKKTPKQYEDALRTAGNKALFSATMTEIARDDSLREPDVEYLRALCKELLPKFDAPQSPPAREPGQEG